MNTPKTIVDPLLALDALIADCSNKHDRVDVLIAAAIELGANTSDCIKSALALCGCNSKHVRIRLGKNTGIDPIAKRWRRDQDGCYHNHPG